MEEEGRLNDMPLRENFIERVVVYPELVAGPTVARQRCCTRSQRPAAWSDSVQHTSSPPWPTAQPDPRSGHYPEMGRLVADAGKRDWDELTAECGAQLMEGLNVMGTRGKHVNVLQHLMGYLKNHQVYLHPYPKQTITMSNPFLINAEKVREHSSQETNFSKLQARYEPDE
jgi:hypothetical protein